MSPRSPARDEDFGAAMRRFDLICPDGMPLVWALNAQLAAGRKTNRPGLWPDPDAGNAQGHRRPAADFRHFLLGGRQCTLDKLTGIFAERFPGVAIAGTHSPPFGEWPADEFDRICGENPRLRAPT